MRRCYNPGMPMESLIRGEWLLRVEGEHETMRLTFRGGLVFENGMEVGAYAIIPDGVRVTIGDDVVLIINAPIEGELPVTMATLRHGEGADLIERARLVRETPLQ